MRIDLGTIPPEGPDPEPGVKPGTRGEPRVAAGQPGDAVQVSLDHVGLDQGRVAALAARVAELPEVRLDKVAALQQAIRGGSYPVTPEHTAGAILSTIEIRPAA